MRRILIAMALLFSISVAHAQMFGKYTTNPAWIISDPNNLLNYQQVTLKFARDFDGADVNSKKISKGKFLKELTTGNYLPLRLNTNDGKEHYVLSKLPLTAVKEIKPEIIRNAKLYLKRYTQEGSKFPAFNYVDINGKQYSSKNTAGKIVVLKTWFIKCGACNREIPELNATVDKYKNRKDVLFVSLATDSKKQLQDFVQKNTFKYAIVPVKETYIDETLKENAYPTHWLINKKGQIVKIAETAQEVIYALNEEAGG